MFIIPGPDDTEKGKNNVDFGKWRKGEKTELASRAKSCCHMT